MDTSWNLCGQPIQPIVLSKSSDSIANDGQMPMTPLMLDALNSSPNSIDNVCNEKQFVIPQRRSSTSYESAYLNNQHHQYSVQGSTSTPNSVGLSSGTASPDVSTQHTNDSTSFQHCNESKWIDRPLNSDSCLSIQEKPARYCYVFHGQPPNGALSTMSDSASIVSNSSAHSTITVPASSIVPASNFSQPAQTLVTIGSPFQTHSLPAPSKPSPIERSSSVPLQNTISLSSNQESVNKTTDFSSLNATNAADSKSKKPKKRKSSDIVDQGQQAKKPLPTTNKEPAKAPSKPTISALTRRRLKTAEKSGETLEKVNLLLPELTVEDLKIICRKYSLAISGTKSDLLRRLQPMEDQIDVEAILLEAMQEEDRQTEEKAKEEEKQQLESVQLSKIIPGNKINFKTSDTISTVKIPITACNGTNQFDVAISNYLLQHRKQLNQQQGHTVTLKPAECRDATCSCMMQKPGFPTAKTIYFAPSATVLNGSAPKTTVIRVPIASFNSAVDPSATATVLSKKLCKIDTTPQCNGPATTFSYAEMGSGGQFTLETTPAKSADPSATMPKFVQISVPSTFCTGVKDIHGNAPACLKCKENQPKEVDGADELQLLINELSLGQINGAIENSTLTARILSLHQQTIKAQYSKLYQMGKLVANSQKVLQCQQGKIESARKAMLKIKASKPASLDTLLKKLDVAQLKEQHNQQTNELKSIQENHQNLKSEQEKLAKLEFQLQEELSIEQAVEDVVRLIKTNRKTALLIVQLVHKFQCDRMREINRIAAKKQETEEKALNCSECNTDQKCGCIKNSKDQRAPVEVSNPAIVTIDESDDEHGHQKQKIGEEDPLQQAKTVNKKKPKSVAKKNNKPVSQRSEHTFAEVMEDIFSTVLSNDCPIDDSNESEEKLPEKLAALIENEERLQKSNAIKSKSSTKSNKTTKSVETQNVHDKIEKSESANSFAFPNMNHGEHQISTPCEVSSEPMIFSASDNSPNTLALAQQPMPHKFESLLNDENSVHSDHSFAHSNCANEQMQTPALYNYMTSTTVTKSEINTPTTPTISTIQTIGTLPINNVAPFLQQKRQILYEQLEQLERQQLHNENSNYCNNIDIDEELANLGDLNVEDLYNYDFDQLDVPTPIDEAPSVAPFSVQPPQYMPHQYQQPQFHNHSHPGFMAHDQPLGHNNQQQQQRHYSNTRHTFQHANSVDFEDVLDLIRNGEKNRQPSMDFEGQVHTNAIYEDLRLNDVSIQRQNDSRNKCLQIDEMSWSDPLADENKQVAVNEN
ncbi:hypothetical protein M3Y97_00838200 [Aphelenchoides bicaudatus]|nr:hypothetical protein M3Y97_00838200 [Aphelenchoides bicaudatus]